MNWTNYFHFAIGGIGALIMIALIARSMPSLTAKRKHFSRSECLILSLSLFVGIVFIYGKFIWGDVRFAYRDAGLDTVDQYVPFYLNLLDSIRDGSFGAWNFDYGLGTSVLSYQSWLLDPFNLALIPLGLLLGNSKLSLILVIVQALKIFLAGLLFNRLAARFCETPFSRIVGSLSYAFCGYLLLWGQHYWLGSVSVAFVALLLSLELLAERWSALRFIGVTLITTVCVGWSPYCGFMILISAALYMLFRLIHATSGPGVARQVATKTGRLLVPVLCGVLLAGAALVPYVMYLFSETGRVASESQPSLLARIASSATGFVPIDWLPGIVSRFLGDSLITSGGDLPLDLLPATKSFPYVNCYEFISLGFGACSLIVLSQFAHWVATSTSKQDKVLLTVAGLIVVLYCVNEFLPSLFNAFVAPKYRSSFVLAAPICLALAVGWEKRIQRNKVAPGPLLTAFIITVVILAWSFLNSVDGRIVCVFCIACVCSLAAILFIKWPSKWCGVFMIAAALITIAPVFADGYFVTNHRNACTETNFPGAAETLVDSDTTAALSYLKEADESLYRIEKTYTDWCDFNDSLVENYQGINSYNSTTDGEVLDFYQTFWPEALLGGGAYQSFANNVDGFTLASQLGVKYLLSKTPIENDAFELFTSCGAVNIYRNTKAASLLYGSSVIASESELASCSSIEERRNTIKQAIVVPDKIAADRDIAQPGTSVTVSNLQVSGNSTITGTAEATGDAVACLSVPHTAGWQVLVDGQKVETFTANIGFIGFNLTSGAHDITAYYEIPNYKVGANLSIAGLLLATLACLYHWKRNGTVY